MKTATERQGALSGSIRTRAQMLQCARWTQDVSPYISGTLSGLLPNRSSLAQFVFSCLSKRRNLRTNPGRWYDDVNKSRGHVIDET